MLEDGAVERRILAYRKGGAKGTLAFDYLDALSNAELHELVHALEPGPDGTATLADTLTADDARAVLRRRAEQGETAAESSAPIARERVKRLLCASPDVRREMAAYQADEQIEAALRSVLTAMATGADDECAVSEFALTVSRRIQAGELTREDAQALVDRELSPPRAAEYIILRPPSAAATTPRFHVPTEEHSSAFSPGWRVEPQA